MLNIRCGPSLLQEAAKRLVAELARDVFQGSQMVARPVRRRNQKKKEMHLVAVETVEIDADGTHADGAYEPFDAGMLGMRNGHAAANAGAAELFALHDGADDTWHLVL